MSCPEPAAAPAERQSLGLGVDTRDSEQWEPECMDLESMDLESMDLSSGSLSCALPSPFEDVLESRAVRKERSSEFLISVPVWCQ